VTLAEDAIPSPDLARDVRAHLPEILGGLARPQTIAFIDEFPADLCPDERRSALSALRATQLRIPSIYRPSGYGLGGRPGPQVADARARLGPGPEIAHAPDHEPASLPTRRLLQLEPGNRPMATVADTDRPRTKASRGSSRRLGSYPLESLGGSARRAQAVALAGRPHNSDCDRLPKEEFRTFRAQPTARTRFALLHYRRFR
jgi:hypothetical protein